MAIDLAWILVTDVHGSACTDPRCMGAPMKPHDALRPQAYSMKAGAEQHHPFAGKTVLKAPDEGCRRT
ncbi:hypothetical protein ASZ90_010820 [hydrocarbon metagenome]|uniref:Uncharacterized protein n=1 Tax=hydrocarbon metagenome TaxID=938273 RepID=A0A0W8FF35_9ZZZZ